MSASSLQASSVVDVLTPHTGGEQSMYAPVKGAAPMEVEAAAEILPLFLEFQKADRDRQRAGLDLGRSLLNWRERYKAQGSRTGAGFKKMLDRLGVPRATAYRLMKKADPNLVSRETKSTLLSEMDVALFFFWEFVEDDGLFHAFEIAFKRSLVNMHEQGRESEAQMLAECWRSIRAGGRTGDSFWEEMIKRMRPEIMKPLLKVKRLDSIKPDLARVGRYLKTVTWLANGKQDNLAEVSTGKRRQNDAPIKRIGDAAVAGRRH
jgi:hypothetical protein